MRVTSSLDHQSAKQKEPTAGEIDADRDLDIVEELAGWEQAGKANDKPTTEPNFPRDSRDERRRGRSRRHVADWQRGRFDFLFFPIRVFNNFLDHWGFDELFFHNAYRIRRLLRSVTRFEGKDVARRSMDGELVLSRVPSVKTLANPIWWCIWAVQFPWLWLISRPFLGMLLAVPALLFLGFCTYVMNAGRSAPQAYRFVELREQLVEAANKQDFDTARFFADVLVQGRPKSAPDFYNRALVGEKAGEIDECKAYMEYAAEELGAGEAALWLANSLGDRNQIAAWSSALQQEYEKWLNIALENGADSVTTTKALADLYRVQGDLKKSYELILTLDKTDSTLAPLLVAMEKELGMDNQARARASSVVDTNLELLRDVPDLVDVRIQTARLLVYLDSLPEAARLLIRRSQTKGISREEFDALRRPIADCLVLFAQRIAETDASANGLMRRLEYLKKAIEYDPTSRPVLDAVVQACVEVAESKNRELMVMQEAIVRGVSADAAHFITGTVALLQGDAERALQHLDIAAENNPNLPGVLNNLAYAICQQEDADLERALRLSEAAVRGSPGNPYALETRGQIFLRLGRLKEAIADLEAALESDELKSSVRLGLAKAYEELGQPAMAARHRELLSKGM